MSSAGGCKVMESTNVQAQKGFCDASNQCREGVGRGSAK